jgi:hypothetical protein
MDATASKNIIAELAADSVVRAAAARCRDELQKWELITRRETPSVESLDNALKHSLQRLQQAAAGVVGNGKSVWLVSLHHDLERAVARREPRPRGNIPWGDDQPGTDVELLRLDAALAGLAGEGAERSATPRPHQLKRGPRGFFRWDDSTRTLHFGPVTSTPFERRKKTSMRMLVLLVRAASHRCHVSELQAAVEDHEDDIDTNNIDRQLTVIRNWLRMQPHPIWQVVAPQRHDNDVQLGVDPTLLGNHTKISNFFNS